MTILTVLTGLALTAQGDTFRIEQALAPGQHEFTLRHQGRLRHYLVHVPRGAASPAPVLLAFHGGGGNPEGLQRYAGLDVVADREGFLVVYPAGSGPLPRRLLTWNAGDGCCGFALDRRIDDVGFAAAVIDDLARRTSIDRSRVYATGHSNGAILAHRLAAERPGLVAAVAPVAGSLDLRRFRPSRPVAVLQIHSVDDPRALYEGGLGPPFPGTQRRVRHQPVVSGLERWISANGCAVRPDTADIRRGAAGSPDAGHTAVLLVWRGCREGVEVAHWKLTVAGHGWPGSEASPLREDLSGPATSIIEAGEEIWRFVSRFRR